MNTVPGACLVDAFGTDCQSILRIGGAEGHEVVDRDARVLSLPLLLSRAMVIRCPVGQEMCVEMFGRSGECKDCVESTGCPAPTCFEGGEIIVLKEGPARAGTMGCLSEEARALDGRRHQEGQYGLGAFQLQKNAS